MSEARRQVLTVALVVFLMSTVASLVLFVLLKSAVDSNPDTEFRDQLGLFVGFMLASITQFICLVIYGEDIWRYRKEMMTNAKWGLLIVFLIGGPWVAIPTYWWARVHRARVGPA